MRSAYLIIILVLVWTGLLSGCWFLASILPRLALMTEPATNALRALVASALIFSWLLLWRTVAYRWFWLTLRKKTSKDS